MPHATSLEENSFMIGRTDSLERRCDIPGCQIFVFEQGCCIVSSKGLRIAVKPGDMAIIFPETSFVPVRVSRNFSCTYLWVDDRIMEKAYNRLTNLAFWDFLYQYPIFSLSERQRQMLSLWLELTRMFASEKSDLYRDSILGNHIQYLRSLYVDTYERCKPSPRRWALCRQALHHPRLSQQNHAPLL